MQDISAMKIWPFDLYAEATGGEYISNSDLKEGLVPFQKIREAVGDAMEIMVEMHSLWNLPSAIKIAQALSRSSPRGSKTPSRWTTSTPCEGSPAQRASPRRRANARHALGFSGISCCT